MMELPQGYISEIDTVDEESWYKIIVGFDDANIYQTWSYGAIRYGEDNISHLILKKNGKIVSAAQVSIIKIPVINMGFAYIRWGPLWKSHNTKINIEAFCQSVRALRNEYVCKRGLVLRLFPILFTYDSHYFSSMLKDEDFICINSLKPDRTLLLDLGLPLEDLRKGFKQKWRNCLNHAEKNDLDIIEGHGDDLFNMFIKIYKEMLDRKKFVEPNDINEFRLIQKNLPDKFKMKIIICLSNGKPSNGIICSAIGSTGIYLFGATNDIGMQNKGSYLLQWKIIEWLKQIKCSYYDLNGINPNKNPGSFRFKSGLSGKNGKDVYFLGRFDSYKNILSPSLVRLADTLRLIYKQTKGFHKNIIRRN